MPNNSLLLVSSAGILLVSLATHLYFAPPVYFSILAGMAGLTSVANHGTLHRVARRIDRCYIPVYVALNLGIVQSNTRISVPTKVILYAVGASGVCSVLKAMYIRSVLPQLHLPLKKENEKESRPEYNFKWDSPGNYYHLYAHVVLMVIHVVVGVCIGH